MDEQCQMPKPKVPRKSKAQMTKKTEGKQNGGHWDIGLNKNILGISYIIPAIQDYPLFWSFCHSFDI